jgi:hypothetical protein
MKHSCIPYLRRQVTQTPVFSNQPFYIPLASQIHMFSQIGPCTFPSTVYFPLVCPESQVKLSSRLMTVGAISFLLPSKPYTTGILAAGVFCLASCCMLVSCLDDFQPSRWRRYIPPKCLFTYGLHGAISQKMATFDTHLVFKRLKSYRIKTNLQCF